MNNQSVKEEYAVTRPERKMSNPGLYARVLAARVLALFAADLAFCHTRNVVFAHLVLAD
jgi:hypothetical protein